MHEQHEEKNVCAPYLRERVARGEADYPWEQRGKRVRGRLWHLKQTIAMGVEERAGQREEEGGRRVAEVRLGLLFTPCVALATWKELQIIKS